jgi:excisionase family DNA binding protein
VSDTTTTPPAGLPAVLTLAETATHLRCSPRTVLRAVAAGRLRAIRLTDGGAPRFAHDDLAAFITGRKPHKSHLAAVHGMTAEGDA